ncbi:MAG: hypothetical protein FJ090_01320, partial [Deltaproteobacteria bacterium]|nr:hypothetical protein [Deltaproteobacteria bacterium]
DTGGGGGGDTGGGGGGGPDTGEPSDDNEDPYAEIEAEVCEETEGDDCNGDLGYGDRCSPEDNENGCSEEKFWAWCNRRNPEYPNIWYDYLYDWVDDRCDGNITLEDPDGDGYPSFTCRNSDGTIYTCTTPLVLVLEPGPVRFSAVSHRFPLVPGVATRWDWPTAATPWLALDRDGDGRITDGAELFGSSTPLGAGAAPNGFAALAPLDGDGDRAITAADPAFAKLLAWTDIDGDGVSAPAELAGLAALGVVSISIDGVDQPRCDGDGNCERERAAISWRDTSGATRAGEIVDVRVRARPDAVAQRQATPR